MANQDNATETQSVFTREDGTTYVTEPFKLAKTKEIADRFRGDHTVNIPLPVAVKGDVDATLRNLRAFVSPEADFAEVLVAKFNGQGLRLDLQKSVKEFLAGLNDKAPWRALAEGEASTEEILAAAQQEVNNERLGAVRKRGTSGGAGKVAQAEAKAAKTINTAVQMYRDLPAAIRANYRQALIDTGSLTVEELDAVDAELASGQNEVGFDGENTSRKGKR